MWRLHEGQLCQEHRTDHKTLADAGVDCSLQVMSTQRICAGSMGLSDFGWHGP